MTTLTKTRAAARHLAQHAPTALARSRAQLLHGQLASPASPALLRQTVIAIRDLAGSGWLTVNADHPDVRAFTHLDTLPSPPPLPVLDTILARCLHARFQPTPSPGHHAAPAPARQSPAADAAAAPVNQLAAAR